MMSLKSISRTGIILAGLFTAALGNAAAQSGGGSFTAPITNGTTQVGIVQGYFTYSTVQCGQNASFLEYYYYPQSWQFTPPASPANANTYDPVGQGTFNQPPQMTFFGAATGTGNLSSCPQPGYQGGQYLIPFAAKVNMYQGNIECYHGMSQVQVLNGSNNPDTPL